MKPFFYLLLLVIIIAPVAANDIFLEKGNNGNDVLVFRSDPPINISGYVIQLNFTKQAIIQDLEPIPPFIGAANIDNNAGIAGVAAFVPNKNSFSNRLARVNITGDENILILVNELYDDTINPVKVTNPTTQSAVVEETRSLPVFTPQPRYFSPGINPVINTLVPEDKSNRGTPERETTTPITTSTLSGLNRTAGAMSINQSALNQEKNGVVAQQESITPIVPGQTQSMNQEQPTPVQKTPLSVIIVILSFLVIIYHKN